MQKNGKEKRINYKVVRREDAEDQMARAYEMLDSLVGAYHDELCEARIAMAWRYGWKPDKDGRLKLGQMTKASDLNAQLHGYDFVMLLNWDVWNEGCWDDAKRKAVIDHELCHATVSVDREDGETKLDEHGNPVYRTRGHDIQEFQEIVKRHGCYTGELEQFAATLMDCVDRPLLSNAG